MSQKVKKIEFLKIGGAAIFLCGFSEDDPTVEAELSVKHPAALRREFEDEIDNLCPFVAKVLFHDEPSKELLQQIKIHGITFHYDDEYAMSAVQISASIQTRDKEIIKINTAKIHLTSNAFGFELDLGVLAESLHDHALLHIRKQRNILQLSLFGTTMRKIEADELEEKAAAKNL